ncbi:DNA-3-methyladenine glycosylase family protein [Mangrovibacillus cuniculi]|uniref:DNA-3-methyladenine glycosylase II n=1 Tax=Mangrovibacillus cuniculi TaxID=2593652 RepID=A0A7S8C9D1_9BACI|nr:DNA-3-methyladenine glycosylase [Mangrovibacillus cuniculi]QPC45768.1 DNA-3-methyladenine glycosylase 2 family protein [Mangrovibacillus cuniculi]
MWEQLVVVDERYLFEEALHRLKIDPLNVIDEEHARIHIPIYHTYEVVSVQCTRVSRGVHMLIKGKDSTTKEAVLLEIKRILGIDQTFDQLENHFSTTPLESLFQRHNGTPIILEWSLFSCLLKSIIHQQLNTKFAATLTTRFVQKYGEKIDGVWFYPTPENVALIPVEELRTLSFSQRKAEYIIDIAKAVLEKKITLDLSYLHTLENQEVEKQLTRIRGIGPWTAQSFLMFGLGRKDLFPVGDIGLQNALKHIYGFENKPSKEWMEKESQSWSPYRSYVALYLWRSLERKE